MKVMILLRRSNLLFWTGLILSLFLLPSSALAYDPYCGDGALDENYEECDDGNFINRDGCSAYCKIEDMEPPTVVSVSIPNEATGIKTRTDDLFVVFSEPIDESTIDNFNVRLEKAGNPLDIDFSLATDQKSLTITINEELFSESRHSLRIKYIKDVAGNVLEKEFVSVFDTATAIDYDAPNVVAKPAGDTYYFAQVVELKAYIGDYTGNDAFLDPTAKIYYTLNSVNPTENSPLYTASLRIRNNTTLRYFALDDNGNKTPIYTERYRFTCPERPNAKKVSRYPSCSVSECNYGFILKSNTCVVRFGSDPDDYKVNAVTAPRFSSSTPMIISTKPAILITREHRGIIPRPIIFKDLKRGILIQFERDTKITTMDGEPFEGYIRTPKNLYMKDYPINFGYSFKSIFEFKDAEGNDLEFFPPYRITIPYTDAFNPAEGVTVLTYDPETEVYTPYPDDLYTVDLNKKEVTVTGPKTGIFFIAQKGKNFNRAVFKDTKDHWARNYIEALYRKGIVKGRAKGVYAPDENLTRAEFTKIALKAIGAETENPDEIEDAPFIDVALYAWYLPYIKKAKELGLIKGYPDGTFKPEQFINRAEAIKILISAFNLDLSQETDSTANTSSQKRYADLFSNQWYFPYVDFVIQNRLLDGLRGRNNKILKSFGPGKPITRGEMAKLAMKTIELSEELAKK